MVTVSFTEAPFVGKQVIMSGVRTMCLIMATITTVVIALPTTSPNPPVTDSEAMEYLKRYNFIGLNNPDPEIAALTDSEGYEMGLLSFQKMYGLEETGTLNEETAALMALPRCGVVDVNPAEDPHLHHGKKKRFAVHGSTWPQTSLTYKIIRYTSDLTEAEVNSEIRRAFEVWERVTPLRFSRVDPDQSADIVILFQAKAHGDSYPFDGKSGVLAHAFYPRYGGDAHFDEDEVWTINTYHGTNLFQVAAHEFGHALGLAHSRISSALMAPFYRGYVPNFTLHQDDIDGIQSLYGGPESTSTSTERSTIKSGTTETESTEATTTEAPSTTPFVPSDPDLADLCTEGAVDAVTQHEHSDGDVRTYAFRKDYYVELIDGQVAEGYPKKISEGWPGLPNDLDAALHWEPTYKTYRVWKDNEWKMITKQISPPRTYFFKGNLYWRFRQGSLDRGYPKEISAGWKLPSDLDAVMALESDGNSYFFKGDSYYVYNRKQHRLLSRSPSKINAFNSGLDAAFVQGKQAYVAKGSQLYQVDNEYFSIVEGYPKDTRKELFGCDRLQHLRSDLTTDNNSGSSGKSSLALISTMISLIIVVLNVV